jgi:arylsulfatase A-like enzyme
MIRCISLALLLLLAHLSAFSPVHAADKSANRPNIIFIIADDLGYGDLGCYGATKVRTPNLDRLAQQGRRFTDAHSSAAVCGPTRYAVITGSEWFRRGKRLSHELLVPLDRMSLPSLCKSSGYATALIGKWHLGYGVGQPDWNGELKPGPLECGFNYFFGTAMTHNEPPQVLVENYRVVDLSPDDPITVTRPKRGQMFGVMQGGKSARLDHEILCELHTEKAVKFIEENKDRPFFLYYGMINVHGPLTPGKRFQGTSQCGVYGDYVQEMDWSVGELLATLDRHGLADNTLVIFTSDNGSMLDETAVAAGHLANGPLLGQKTDAWEGGHRVPYLVRWPGRVPEDSQCDELICLADTLATIAAVLGRDLGPNDAPDSFNILPAMLDEPGRRPARPLLTTTAIAGFAIREGNWKLIPRRGSCGFSTSGQWMPPWRIGRTPSGYTSDGHRLPDAPLGQLYNLADDPGETKNLYHEHPEIVMRLTKLWNKLWAEGRSQREVATELNSL